MDQTLLDTIRANLITYYGTKTIVQLTDEGRTGNINQAKLELAIIEAYNAIGGVVSTNGTPFALSLVRRLAGFYLMDQTNEDVRKSIASIMAEAKQASELSDKKDMSVGIEPDTSYVQVERVNKYRDSHLWE